MLKNSAVHYKKRHKKISAGQIVLGIGLGIFALICLLPLLLCVVVSFSSDTSIALKGYTFFPSEWSLKAWEYVGKFGTQLLRSYGVTIFVTVVGTAWGVLLMALFAYAISRKDFALRKFLGIFILIPMLFNGGMISSYLVNTQMYHLSDSLWALILPGVSTMHIIMMRTYIQTNIPDAVIESARIDGAGEIRTFASIVLPMMLPSMAAISFMLAVGYWNEWQQAFIYISSPEKTPLQLMMVRIQNNIDFLLQMAAKNPGVNYTELKASLPDKSARMAIMLVVEGPIFIAFPFFQKYFVKGLTVGSVKG